MTGRAHEYGRVEVEIVARVARSRLRVDLPPGLPPHLVVLEARKVFEDVVQAWTEEATRAVRA